MTRADCNRNCKNINGVEFCDDLCELEDKTLIEVRKVINKMLKKPKPQTPSSSRQSVVSSNLSNSRRQSTVSANSSNSGSRRQSTVSANSSTDGSRSAKSSNYMSAISGSNVDEDSIKSSSNTEDTMTVLNTADGKYMRINCGKGKIADYENMKCIPKPPPFNRPCLNPYIIDPFSGECTEMNKIPPRKGYRWMDNARNPSNIGVPVPTQHVWDSYRNILAKNF